MAGARNTDPETSHAAYESIDATPLQAIVMETLAKMPEGGTTHEIADSCGIGYWTITPRIKPMVEKGLVYDTGQRRTSPETNRKSIVWQLTSRRSPGAVCKCGGTYDVRSGACLICRIDAAIDGAKK